MSRLVESWLYADLDGLRTISISEDGVAWTDFTLTASATVLDALEDWEDQANADVGLALTYAFSWSASTQQVVFAASGAFHLEVDGSLPTALGFASGSLGSSASHASSLLPQAIANCGLTVEPVELSEDIRTLVRRWGRVEVAVHVLAKVVKLLVLFSPDQQALRSSPLMHGRLRAWQDTAVSDPYDVAHPTGYLDFHPARMRDAQTLGVADGWTMLEVEGTLEVS